MPDEAVDGLGPCQMCGDPGKYRLEIASTALADDDLLYSGVVCSEAHVMDWCLGVAQSIYGDLDKRRRKDG